MFRTKKEDQLKYAKSSFSQSGEDLIVDFIFGQLKIDKPGYIDIGAHHPFYLNNTSIFYKRGSRGINIEPDPSLFEKFKKFRKGDINLNIGIGEEPGVSEFYVMNAPTLNTFSKEQVETYKSEGNYHIKEVKKIKVDTVQNILTKYNGGVFPDFMSLDAEGIDELVLKSIDYNNKPAVICVETLSFSSTGKGVKNNEIIAFLQTHGYFLYADTFINSIFVSSDKWSNQ